MIRKILLVLAAVVLSVSSSSALAAGEKVADGDKVLVVMVYDGSCHIWCDKVRPIISAVTDTYGDKVVLRELDVQDSALKESLGTAEKLGVQPFVKEALAWVPTVGVFTPKRKLVRSLTGVNKSATYKRSIEKALNSAG